MKRTLSLITCVAICCAMMASCKNNKMTEEPTIDVIQKKLVIDDSVLATIDELSEKYWVTWTFRVMDLQ